MSMSEQNTILINQAISFKRSITSRIDALEETLKPISDEMLRRELNKPPDTEWYEIEDDVLDDMDISREAYFWQYLQHLTYINILNEAGISHNYTRMFELCKDD